MLRDLREALAAIEEVYDDASRVRLIGFGPYSIDVEVFAHVGTTNWVRFLEIAEDINLSTIAVIEQTGASFAEPPRGLPA